MYVEDTITEFSTLGHIRGLLVLYFVMKLFGMPGALPARHLEPSKIISLN